MSSAAGVGVGSMRDEMTTCNDLKLVCLCLSSQKSLLYFMCFPTSATSFGVVGCPGNSMNWRGGMSHSVPTNELSFALQLTWTG